MNGALESLRRAPSDFAVTPDDIWDDEARPHVPGINDEALGAIEAQIDLAERSPRASVYGLPIVGEGGRGKSHLLGQTRVRVQSRGGFFVHLKLLHLDQFWPNLVSSYLDALESRRHRLADTGLAHLLGTIAEQAQVPAEARTRVLDERVPDYDSATRFVESVRALDPTLAGTRNTLRALILLHSKDENMAAAGEVFLKGGDIDPEAAPGFPRPKPEPAKEVVRELSQLMALCGATAIAVDQVDDIVRASRRGTEDRVSRSAGDLLDMLGTGLMDVRDGTRRTTVILSCLNSTWAEFKRSTTGTIMQRFEPPVWLADSLPSPRVAADLLAAVLSGVYRQTGFEPPYPSYPFPLECLDAATNFSPRHLLRAASDHLRTCVAAGEVSEPTGQIGIVSSPVVAVRSLDQGGVVDLDDRFERYRADADVRSVTSKDSEDARVPQLLSAGLRAFRIETGRDSQDFEVRPSVGQSQAFHVEAYDRASEPVRRWVFKAVANPNGRAVGNRVRRLYEWARLGENNPVEDDHGVLWVTAPTDKWGKWTRSAQVWEWIERFDRDGTTVMASEDDIRTLSALHRMDTERVPGFEEWLRERLPASNTDLFRTVFGPPPATPTSGKAPDAPDLPQGPTAGGGGPSPSEAPDGEARFLDIPLAPQHRSPPREPDRSGRLIDLPLARRSEGDAVHADLRMMAKHTAVFAGSGSGKTVLLRRIVEAAALQGIPAIVLDPNNDLSRLGNAWPEPPDRWLPGDESAAAEYLADTDVVVWTPGRTGGRPLSFQPLPDFAAVADDPDEFDIAVDTAVSSLAPRAMIDRSSPKHSHSRAVLRQALVAYARSGSSDFPGFLDFMDDLPPEASDFDKADDLARQVSATLRAAMVNDRIFAGTGAPADPGELLRATEGKRARVSVVNFLGLPTEEQRQGFVNQLQLALFAWAKRNPATDRPLSALFVLDEAQTFAPSTGSTVCLDSTLALVSQARKYGLGMVFATQAPKGIHNRIVGNCATHWYGRINSPSQIAAATQVAEQKGGSTVDIAHLRTGQFYLAADGSPTEQVDVPMCLSHHPPTAPTAEEILAAVKAAD